MLPSKLASCVRKRKERQLQLPLTSDREAPSGLMARGKRDAVRRARAKAAPAAL
jgi:hypothetical protein